MLATTGERLHTYLTRYALATKEVAVASYEEEILKEHIAQGLTSNITIT